MFRWWYRPLMQSRMAVDLVRLACPNHVSISSDHLCHSAALAAHAVLSRELGWGREVRCVIGWLTASAEARASAARCDFHASVPRPAS